jgi:predicted nucleic acid-binding protein
VSSHLFVLDTTAWVRLNRRNPPEPLASRCNELVLANLVAYNQVIRLEVLVGCRDASEYKRNDDDFAGLLHLPVDQSTWDLACQLGFDLRRGGETASVPDLVIAASALEHDAIVLHVDRDFDRIAANFDLRVESYAEISST